MRRERNLDPLKLLIFGDHSYASANSSMQRVLDESLRMGEGAQNRGPRRILLHSPYSLENGQA